MNGGKAKPGEARPAAKRRPRCGEGVETQLCPGCGLCCDGTLFGDVRLSRDDNGRALAAQGAKLRSVRGHVSLPQPCSCFDGKWCRAYADRPAQCRNFECRLVQRVKGGKLALPAASRGIRAARRQIARIREFLRSLGQTAEAMPLNLRCAEVAARPYDLASDGSEAAHRRKLLLAMGRLAVLLERDFLT